MLTLRRAPLKWGKHQNSREQAAAVRKRRLIEDPLALGARELIETEYGITAPPRQLMSFEMSHLGGGKEGGALWKGPMVPSGLILDR